MPNRTGISGVATGFTRCNGSVARQEHTWARTLTGGFGDQVVCVGGRGAAKVGCWLPPTQTLLVCARKIITPVPGQGEQTGDYFRGSIDHRRKTQLIRWARIVNPADSQFADTKSGARHTLEKEKTNHGELQRDHLEFVLVAVLGFLPLLIVHYADRRPRLRLPHVKIKKTTIIKSRLLVTLTNWALLISF